MITRFACAVTGHESKSFGKADLSKVQGCQARPCSQDYLRESKAQTEAGVG